MKKSPQILINQQLNTSSKHKPHRRQTTSLCCLSSRYNYISGFANHDTLEEQILEKLIINSICMIQWPQKWCEPEFCLVKDLYLIIFCLYLSLMKTRVFTAARLKHSTFLRETPACCPQNLTSILSTLI